MLGQVCRCMNCNRLLAVQNAGMVETLHSYLRNVDAPPDDSWAKLTNGAFVMWAPVILCAGCTPEGATVTPLAEIGVRP